MELNSYQICFEHKRIKIFKKYLCLNVCTWERGVGESVDKLCLSFVTLKCKVTSGLTFCKESWQSTF